MDYALFGVDQIDYGNECPKTPVRHNLDDLPNKNG